MDAALLLKTLLSNPEIIVITVLAFPITVVLIIMSFIFWMAKRLIEHENDILKYNQEREERYHKLITEDLKMTTDICKKGNDYQRQEHEVLSNGLSSILRKIDELIGLTQKLIGAIGR